MRVSIWKLRAMKAWIVRLDWLVGPQKEEAGGEGVGVRGWEGVEHGGGVEEGE